MQQRHRCIRRLVCAAAASASLERLLGVGLDGGCALLPVGRAHLQQMGRPARARSGPGHTTSPVAPQAHARGRAPLCAALPPLRLAPQLHCPTASLRRCNPALPHRRPWPWPHLAVLRHKLECLDEAQRLVHCSQLQAMQQRSWGGGKAMGRSAGCVAGCARPLVSPRRRPGERKIEPHRCGPRAGR